MMRQTASVSNRTDLLLGRASVDITPAVGLPLGGWPQERASTTVDRPLSARVLVLRQGSTAVVLCALDLLGMDAAVATETRRAISQRVGIPADHILLCSSHTHSGPVMPPCAMEGLSPPDELYLEDLRRKLVGAVALGCDERIPVRVAAGLGASDLGVSRRLPDADGHVGWPPRANPNAEIDSTVGVVRFDDPDGATVAVLFSYGCHPTVAGPSKLMGPDYPGRARAHVESTFSGALAFFVLGNAADVRTNYTNPDGTFVWDPPAGLIDEAGLRLGSEVVRVACQLRPQPVEDLRVGLASGEVVTTSGDMRLPCGFHAVRLGSVDLVTNPAECFSEIGLELRRAWHRSLIFSSVTNGIHGYVPTRSAYEQGGYEVAMSYRHFGLDSPLRDDSAEVFRSGMHRALGRLEEPE